MPEKELIQLVIDLYDVNAIKVTDVILKTGHVSPIYIDLRVIVSKPKLLKRVAQAIWLACLKLDNNVNGNNSTSTKYDVICGVPYTALPIATCISLNEDIPMVVRRKEAKSYGTKKLIEGVFNEGDNVLLVEDVLTSGTSVLETANALMQSGLKVTSAVVLLDRNQTGIENLRKEGIRCNSVLDLKKVISILAEAGKIDLPKMQSILSWLENNPCDFSAYSINEKSLLTLPKNGPRKLPFEERLKEAQKRSNTGINVTLFDIIIKKQSNLCVSIDVDSVNQLLTIAEQVAPYVCAIKVHVDVLKDFSFETFVQPLTKLSNEYNFLILEDRKFADIGNVVRLQYNRGIFKIADWAHLVTAHAISGPGVVTGLKCELKNDKRGVLLIAEMSSDANLLTKSNVEASYNLAQKHPDVVAGFICQHQVTTDPTLLHLTPGVSKSCNSDSLGQRYVTPDIAIGNGADVLIVGRGITSADDIKKTAEEYKKQIYQLYLDQCK